MADTYTSRLNMVKPEINGSLNTWGNKLNSNTDLVDVWAIAKETQLASLTSGLAAATAGGVPIGTILMWSGAVSTIPTGYRLCDGSNGTPDLRSRFVMGAGNGGSYGGPGAQGGAATATTSTDTQGSHSHGGSTGGTAISEAQMPSHQHGGTTNGGGSHTHSMGTNVLAYGNGGQPGYTAGGYFSGISTINETQWVGDHQHSFSTDARGGNQAHNHSINGDGSHAHNLTVATLPPYVALAFIMRVN